jgi:glutathione synthase/RimK-type ligase-like ATP-grasp enzyme
MLKIIVSDKVERWGFIGENIKTVSTKDYLVNPQYANLKNIRIFNLNSSYKYQSKGYYVSLLAEARGHKVIPSVKNLVDLKAPVLVKAISLEFDDLLQKKLKDLKSTEFSLSVYFGQNLAKKYKDLSNMLFRQFQIPFLRINFEFHNKWEIKSVKALSSVDIPTDHWDFVEDAAGAFFNKKRYLLPKPNIAKYDLGILINPQDLAPPSNAGAIKKFIEIGEKLNFYVELLSPKDLARLSAFDALFIRQSTEVNNEAYAFARKAQQEGIAIIDYPDAILKCCNKVYMAEALSAAQIPTPKTCIVHKENKQNIVKVTGLPVVLKAPDSTFSFGVKKANTEEEYNKIVMEMLKKSDLIIAQAFCPSDYDWRIGVLDGVPFYACRYFMAKGHWQIYNWQAKNKKHQDGKAEAIALEEVPKKILDLAVKSANLMGKGLYGIDLKEIKNEVLVIEINDNPNIDTSVEDAIYKDKIYQDIFNAFLSRLEL